MELEAEDPASGPTSFRSIRAPAGASRSSSRQRDRSGPYSSRGCPPESAQHSRHQRSRRIPAGHQALEAAQGGPQPLARRRVRGIYSCRPWRAPGAHRSTGGGAGRRRRALTSLPQPGRPGEALDLETVEGPLPSGPRQDRGVAAPSWPATRRDRVTRLPALLRHGRVHDGARLLDHHFGHLLNASDRGRVIRPPGRLGTSHATKAQPSQEAIGRFFRRPSIERWSSPGRDLTGSCVRTSLPSTTKTSYPARDLGSVVVVLRNDTRRQRCRFRHRTKSEPP
jgi:hypothetical protein